jgi:FMN phosphatase YigB (HAD superfamily)
MTTAAGPAVQGPIEAVTFDYWATLVQVPVPVEVRARRVDSLGSLLRERGHDISDETLDSSLDRITKVHTDHWRTNRQYTYDRGVNELLEMLDLSPSAELKARVIERFTGSSSDFVPPLTPNVAAALGDLRARGVRVGIVCDVGLSPSTVLRRHLERHEVLELFDHWSFSDDVGVYKPAPEIFRHALDGLGGVAPERAAHVGDLKGTDVAGARAMGMRSVRYRGDNDDAASAGPEADIVVDDHAELLAALGVESQP